MPEGDRPSVNLEATGQGGKDSSANNRELWTGASFELIVDALRNMSDIADPRELVRAFTDQVGSSIYFMSIIFFD